MTDEEKKKRAEHNRVFFNDVKEMGMEAFVCTHIESGEREIFSNQARTIEMGESRVAFLCSLCSGMLVESMTKEILGKLIEVIKINQTPKRDPKDWLPPIETIADDKVIQETGA